MKEVEKDAKEEDEELKTSVYPEFSLISQRRPATECKDESSNTKHGADEAYPTGQNYRLPTKMCCWAVTCYVL